MIIDHMNLQLQDCRRICRPSYASTDTRHGHEFCCSAEQSALGPSKTKQRPAKTNKDEQRQEKTNKDRKKQAKTN